MASPRIIQGHCGIGRPPFCRHPSAVFVAEGFSTCAWRQTAGRLQGRRRRIAAPEPAQPPAPPEGRQSAAVKKISRHAETQSCHELSSGAQTTADMKLAHLRDRHRFDIPSTGAATQAPPRDSVQSCDQGLKCTSTSGRIMAKRSGDCVNWETAPRRGALRSAHGNSCGSPLIWRHQRDCRFALWHKNIGLTETIRLSHGLSTCRQALQDGSGTRANCALSSSEGGGASSGGCSHTTRRTRGGDCCGACTPRIKRCAHQIISENMPAAGGGLDTWWRRSQHLRAALCRGGPPRLLRRLPLLYNADIGRRLAIVGLAGGGGGKCFCRVGMWCGHSAGGCCIQCVGDCVRGGECGRLREVAASWPGLPGRERTPGMMTPATPSALVLWRNGPLPLCRSRVCPSGRKYAPSSSGPEAQCSSTTVGNGKLWLKVWCAASADCACGCCAAAAASSSS